MYIYNYLHIWRAARYVKNPPANNYGENRVLTGALRALDDPRVV